MNKPDHNSNDSAKSGRNEVFDAKHLWQGFGKPTVVSCIMGIVPCFSFLSDYRAKRFFKTLVSFMIGTMMPYVCYECTIVTVKTP